MKKQIAKLVTIIARVQFKSDPRKVCYIVRSSNGHDQYTTCLFDGKACSCTCPATKPCYHMTQLEQREQERNLARDHAAHHEAVVNQAIAEIEEERQAPAPARQPIAPRVIEDWDSPSGFSTEYERIQRDNRAASLRYSYGYHD